MPFPCYLAMTAAEIQCHQSLPAQVAWMACHFSPYGLGLSNCPHILPEGSMVIVNDRTPVFMHSPEIIARQLGEIVEEFQCSRVLLDFQRPGSEETSRITDAICTSLSCPVGVSDLYAKDLDCPVFLPPPPLHISLECHIAPWKHREIWLEAAMDTEEITVTESGSQFTLCQDVLSQYPHLDSQLHCHYCIDKNEDAVVFTLHRTLEDLEELAQEAEQMGISQFIGLYQELGEE